jgi:hypothetical protein
VVTWFRRHVEVNKWGRITLVFAAAIELSNAAFNCQDGKYAWATWWGFVGVFALFAAIFAAPTPKKKDD